MIPQKLQSPRAEIVVVVGIVHRERRKKNEMRVQKTLRENALRKKFLKAAMESKAKPKTTSSSTSHGTKTPFAQNTVTDTLYGSSFPMRLPLVTSLPMSRCWTSRPILQAN